ncbi:MAG: fasciclin domain-containing protein [Bacteroidales bacterium]|nr:fasciclin domain-containing protein [Bacteroidales bacterium]
MNYKIIITGLIVFFVLFGCKNEWDEHYNTVPETIDMNVWQAIQNDNNLSLFVQYVKDLQFDTLFLTDQPYTIFVPDNEAFTGFLDTAVVSARLLNYHISAHFIQSNHINGKRRIQTLGEKFALFENDGLQATLDEINFKYESPLYVNGKYYVLEKVALPKPNLYEYFEESNPILKDFIDSYDSTIIDKELSRPLGFDEFGNTIYDTVAIEFNLFEAMVFPVSEELRYNTATFVFPKEEDYNNGLTAMAQSLGPNFQDYKDIPLEWQNDILIPYLLEYGIFDNMLEESAFLPRPGRGDTIRLKNILGDSIDIEYQPVEKALCSNGYAYNYANFVVPDTLYNSPLRMEGEYLLRDVGINKYAWNEDVDVSSTVSFQPLQELILGTASNDSILRVAFTKNYTGSFTVEFNIDYVFPRKYLMVVRTHMYMGGKYNIYMNDQLVKTIDYYDYTLNRGAYWSVTGKRYFPEGAYNRFDCWVENLTEYGVTKVKFEYIGYSNSTLINSGLAIDYIDLIPYN